MFSWFCIGAVLCLAAIPAEPPDRNFYGILTAIALIVVKAWIDRQDKKQVREVAETVTNNLKAATARAEGVVKELKDLIEKHDEKATESRQQLREELKENTRKTEQQSRLLEEMQSKIMGMNGGGRIQPTGETQA